jgi:hypothetical protein
MERQKGLLKRSNRTGVGQLSRFYADEVDPLTKEFFI